MAQLAFYKGKGNWVDGLIRWVTRSPYSHVELILERPNVTARGEALALCYSSSARDGGVRTKVISLNPDHWDLVEIEWYVGNHIPLTFKRLFGAEYDYAGLIFSQFFNWRWHNKKRWFCSEIIAHVLELPNPHEFSPGGLRPIIEKMNAMHRQGICEGQRNV